MSLIQSRGGLAILASFCVALILTILPLPEWAQPFRPQWVTLVLIYWTLALPHRVGVGIGFLNGMALDVLTGTLLGQHALGLSIVAFATVTLHQRVRVFPLWQQSLVVLVLLVVEHLLALWVMGATGETPPGLSYWAIPPIGAMLWPWVFVILRDIRRRFHVR
jgi:rod shape-determining protein MreD